MSKKNEDASVSSPELVTGVLLGGAVVVPADPKLSELDEVGRARVKERHTWEARSRTHMGDRIIR